MTSLKKPKFEVEIIEKIEVRLQGDNTYYSARNEAHAQQLKKEILEEAEADWEKEYSAKARAQQELEYVQHNVINYTEHLKKQLWHMARDGTSKAVLEIVKNMNSELEGVLKGTLLVEWSQDPFSDATFYTLKQVDDYNRGDSL